MANKFGGNPNTRMSNTLTGDERSHRGADSYRAHSTVRSESYLNDPTLGTSGPFKSNTLTSAPGKTNLQKVKNIPRTYVPTVKPPVKKPPVAVKKPPVKKPPTVISNVIRERLSPAKALPSNKPPATRFGVVTGKVTGTTARGGGGYGGGGTRGSGSLSGQGSGTRSAGTSRTGGTQRNDPVRG